MPEAASIEGQVFLAPPFVAGDHRGWMAPWFDLAEAGRAGWPGAVHEATCSVSHRGVIRGIHFAPGRAKYVTCLAGAVFDVAVDLRRGSPTFGCWHGEVLSAAGHRSVYLAPGLGHAHLTLEDSVVAYLYSTPHDGAAYHAVHPLDPGIGITWPEVPGGPVLSAKDAAAPGLAEWEAAHGR